MIPVAAVIGILPTVIQALSNVAGQTGLLDEDKSAKIVDLASKALGGVGFAVEAFRKVSDAWKNKDLTSADFDALIAEIDANTARIDELAAGDSH